MLSHVDSEDMLACEDTSSSLVAVEAERESRSPVDASSDSMGFELVVRDSPFVAGCSVEDSVSASSAQLFTWEVDVTGFLVASSLAGVAEPEAGLLAEGGLDMPFAACAYENVAAILANVCGIADMLCGKCRCCASWEIPGGTARGCWPVQELALLCPERQADLPALYVGKC